MTDVENNVYQKYLDKDYSWVPIGRSLAFETVKKIENEEVSLLSQVKDQIKKS